MAGLDDTDSLAENFHRSDPSLVTLYKLESYDPKTISPDCVIAGLEYTESPVTNDHFSWGEFMVTSFGLCPVFSMLKPYLGQTAVVDNCDSTTTTRP
jgi:hypothetical protein